MTQASPTPFRTDRPFRAHDARTAGVSLRRLHSSVYRRIALGVYIDASAGPNPLHDAQAAVLLAGPHSFASHQTAARLYGATVPHDADLHASVPGECHRSRKEGVMVHRSARTPIDHRGVPVTSPTDTFLDLAASLSLIDLVVAGDALVRKQRTTPEGLVLAAQAQGGSRARRAAALVRSGVDSPMETRLRLLVTLAGLPEPEVNLTFRDLSGEVVRRLDMGYRSARLGLEYDGRQHADSAQQYRGDVRRREDFAGLGWRLWTAVSADLYAAPGQALDRVADVMRQQGMRVPPLRDEWRRHFPGHH